MVVLSPVVFTLSVAIHVKLDATLLVKGILTVAPLQIVAVLALVIAGFGFTVTVAIIAAPVQPFTGVIVYVAVPGLAPIVVNVCVMFAPAPLDAPVTPD